MRGFWKVNLYKSIPSCLEKKSATSNKIFKFPPVYFFHICFFSASACTVLHSIKKKREKRRQKFMEQHVNCKEKLKTCSVLLYLFIYYSVSFLLLKVIYLLIVEKGVIIKTV